MTRRSSSTSGAIIAATGYKPFDARRIPEYGYGKYPNVYTAPEVERLLNASGPTQGEIVLRTGQRPRTVGIIHCVGSRDARYNPYCSSVCCMYWLKLAHLIKDTPGRRCTTSTSTCGLRARAIKFYQKVMKEGVHLIRGRVAEANNVQGGPSGAARRT